MTRLAILTCILLCACGTDRNETDVPLPQGAEAFSFLGDTLYPLELPANVQSVYDENLAGAKVNFDANPDDADAIVWLGRRTAYLGQYREAIRIFTEGVNKHPDDARFLRHRGHRYMSVRDLDRAVEDLSRAAGLITGKDDAIEPDGLPNAAGFPTSTLHTNIWYHLGLAYYLDGNFEQALDAYERGVGASTNPDMLIAMTYWQYMTLRRMGREDDASRILGLIEPGLQLIENQDYYRLLQLNQGTLSLEDLTGNPDEATDLSNATVGYGIGNWHWMNGRADEALVVWRSVLQGSQWAAFGYIAAEAEIARLEK